MLLTTARNGAYLYEGKITWSNVISLNGLPVIEAKTVGSQVIDYRFTGNQGELHAVSGIAAERFPDSAAPLDDLVRELLNG